MITNFQYPEVRFRLGRTCHTAINAIILSIPGGAIQTPVSVNKRGMFWYFQYPEVRFRLVCLKAIERFFPPFNTRRCDSDDSGSGG